MSYGKVWGYAERGGKVRTSGVNSTTSAQVCYPLATVTVYDTGTLNLATIYSDGVGTSKANPFQADTYGYWEFYADVDLSYDVQFSGAMVPSPFTFADQSPRGGGGVASAVYVAHVKESYTAAQNAAAIMAALALAAGYNTGAETYGGIVEIPEGEYVSDTITISQQSLTLRGRGPGSMLRWGGTAGTPLIRLLDTSRVRISDMTLLGASGNLASAAIHYDNVGGQVAGTNEFVGIERVMIGRKVGTSGALGGGVYGPFDVGIKLGGATDANTDTAVIRDCQIYDCTTAGIYAFKTQACWNVVSNVLCDSCGTGLYVKGGTVVYNLMCNRNVTEDIHVTASWLTIYGYYSEHAEKLWTQDPGATLAIYGGRALLHAEMTGNAYYAVSAVSADASTTEQNFILQNFIAIDTVASGAVLKIAGSSSNTGDAYVTLRGNRLPSGNSDAGYEITGYGTGTYIYLDIQQGNWWRRGLVPRTGAPSTGNLSIPNYIYQYEQAFVLYVTNDTGTLKHAIRCTTGATGLPRMAYKIPGANGSLSATGATFNAGGAVAGSAFIFNTNDQVDNLNTNGVASVVMNSTGTALTAELAIASRNVGGVTIARPEIQLRNATSGAAVNFNTTDIPAGTVVAIQIRMFVF